MLDKAFLSKESSERNHLKVAGSVLSIGKNNKENLRNTRSWLRELEQSSPMDEIKGSFRGLVWASKFDMKHLKKTEVYIGKNVVNITKKIRSIVRIF